LIIEPLSDEERNKINQIIKNKEAKSGEIYIHYENKKVSWGSMQRLLKSDTKNHPKRWIDDKVINFYVKNYLAEIDQKRCQEEPEQNCSGFLGSYFWQTLTNEKNNDMKVQGKYNYKNVSKWSKKLPGKDIFNLKKIFIPINIENQHWACIVIFMKEKRIQYYDSHAVGAGNSHMNDVLRYLVNEDKGQGCVKREEWALVPSTETVPKQENTIDCGTFICMFGSKRAAPATMPTSGLEVLEKIS
jgi:sentrin-specific protease 1